jgi:hypothetical protein
VGTTSVDGGVTIVDVAWTKAVYRATFSETGLPADQVWSVSLNGTSQALITSGGDETLVWTGLSNGTYPYAITPTPGWHESTLALVGSVRVSGGSQPVDGSGLGYSASLTYAQQTYGVVFSESGLAAGAGWSLNVSHGSTLRSSGPAISVALPNGTYTFVLASSDPLYAPNPFTGVVAVTGFNVTENVTFALVTFSVTIAESGLSSGAPWWVNLTGGQSFVSRGTQLVFQEPNGSYSYAVSAQGRSPVTGTFSVQGRPLTLPTADLGSAAGPFGSVVEWALVGGVVAAIGLLAAVLFFRRRKGARPRPVETSAPKDPSPGPPGSP